MELICGNYKTKSLGLIKYSLTAGFLCEVQPLLCLIVNNNKKLYFCSRYQ